MMRQAGSVAGARKSMEVPVISRSVSMLLPGAGRDAGVRQQPAHFVATHSRQISGVLRSCMLGTVIACASLSAVEPALAFDDKVFDDKTGVKPKSNPFAVFRFGFSAYHSGHKE